jgi:hypothetical protein
MHVTGSDPDTNSLPLAGFEVLGLAQDGGAYHGVTDVDARRRRRA